MTISEILAKYPSLSYRQLDYWLERGYLRVPVLHPGEGNQRSLSQAEVKVLGIMLDLTEVGVRPAKAAKMARTLHAGRDVQIGRYKLTSG